MLIAFTGLMGSGKTTASDHLVNTMGYVKINFKDALVEEMKDRLGAVLSEMIRLYESDPFVYDGKEKMTVDWLFQNKPPLMRVLMQAYGTEVRRRDNNSYWTDQWKEKVRAALRSGSMVVTDDCRFLNEEQAIRDMGGKIVLIIRNDITDTGTHQSEVEQKLIIPDVAITANKGERKELYEKISEFIKGYG